MWRIPYTVNVEIGNGEGLGDIDHIKVRLPQGPHFWQLSSVANTVGHEFGHMMMARLVHIDKPLYGWSSPDSEPVNFIHYADGLNRFFGNPEYIESHWKVDYRRARILRIVVFDVEKLSNDKAKIQAFIAGAKHEPQWDFS